MTAPGGSAGDAYIDFHARTKDVKPDLERALRDAANDADDFLDKAGERWGNTISDSMADEIRDHGPHFARSVEHALAGETISLAGVRYKVDSRGFLHDFDTGRFVGKLVSDIVDGLNSAASAGGPISKAGEGFADAIGAIFNVSGKSPLIAFLIPVFGTLAALIGAALQAANALIATLTTLPALLVAVGLQAGVVMLAFDGMGEAISGAFSAKNATELYEAIKNLTPSAQNFVKSLLPLRDLFNSIKRMAQEGFFSAFGDTLTQVASKLGPIFTSNKFWQLAQAMGTMFRDIALFFASPTFVKFLDELIPATVRWLGTFGPGFADFMNSVFIMATAAIPFLERLGMVVGNAFGTFGDWLREQTESGKLTEWLDRMGTTLDKVVELFFKAAEFVKDFLSALDQAGGNNLIDQFSDLFERLSIFFQSEAGIAAMQSFIHIVELLTYSFSGFIFVLMGALIAFEAVLQFFGFVGSKFMEFIEWLIGPATTAVADFFTVKFPEWLQSVADAVAEWVGQIGENFKTSWQGIVNWFQNLWNGIVAWFQARVNDVTSFFSGIPDRLREIGQQIMQGLKDGLQWGWDHTVGPLLNWVTNAIPDWKGPEEKDKRLLQPAGKAVMTGFGKGLQEGAEQLRSMLGDFTGNIKGSGAGMAPVVVNLGFHGALPTEEQAYDLGKAAGRGAQDQLSQRDVALAVRVV